MHNLASALRVIPFLAACAFLFGCTTPSIRASSVAKDITRFSEIRFLYYRSEMKVTSSFGNGQVNVFSGDTGFYDFGDKLVARAEPAFSAHGIRVLSSRQIYDPKESIPESLFANSTVQAAPTLMMLATAGSASANPNVTRVSFVFTARLFDPARKQVIWSAVIDTSTVNGKGWISGNLPKTLYDEKYADELFKAVTERMKADGVI